MLIEVLFFYSCILNFIFDLCEKRFSSFWALVINYKTFVKKLVKTNP